MKCTNCNEDLEEDKFYFRKDTNKYHPNCKKCHNKINWQRNVNGLVKNRYNFDFICIFCRKKKSENSFYLKDKKSKRYDTTCQECRKEEAKRWYENNTEKAKENKKKWHKTNRDKNLEKCKAYYRKRVEMDPEKEYESRKKWRLDNLDKINDRYKQRYNSDINFKLGSILRSNCARLIKNGCKKYCKTLEILDCDIEFVKEWLSGQFQEKMSWENHGSYWQLDHFYPVSCFDLSKREEQNKCFHWSNLQPLTKQQNLSKSCKIPSDNEINLHLSKIFEFCKSKNKGMKSIMPEIQGTISG